MRFQTLLTAATLLALFMAPDAALGQDDEASDAGPEADVVTEEPAPQDEPVARRPAAEDGVIRIYISADLAGVAGAETGEQLGPDGFEYERFREFMTAEVNAAIDAARAAGADEFLVSDAHGNGQSLLI